MSPPDRSLSYRLLGPLEVVVGEEGLTLGGPRSKALLAMLIANSNRPVSLDDLVSAAWEQPPSTAAHQVRNRISELRNVLRTAMLPHDTIRNAGTGYLLFADASQCDVIAFEAAVRRANGHVNLGSLSDAKRELTSALSLWRGTALEGLSTAPLLAIAAALTEQRVLAREELFDVELGLGRHEQIIAPVQVLVTEEPWRERPIRQLMTALYRSGRQREALDQFRQFSRKVNDDLGLDPGPELSALRDQILRQDGALLQAPVPPLTVSDPHPVVAWHPPAPLADFVGRHLELGSLEAHLRACLGAGSAPIAAISGLPGSGKTSLAISAIHRLRYEFPAGQLYVDLHGHAEPRDPAQVLHRFLRTIGVAGDAVPEDVDEAADLYRSRLSQSPRLIVLDNAASVVQIRLLLPPAECPVIITSRRMLTDLDGACFLAMEPMPERDALELLARAVGWARVSEDRDSAVSIVTSCGRLPLAVRIAAAQALTPEMQLVDLARRLSDGSQVLNNLTTVERSIRTSLLSAFETLAVAEQQLLCDLAVVTTDDFPEWVALVARSEESMVSQAVLTRLVEAGFADALGRDRLSQLRFRLHDLVRQFATEQSMQNRSTLERRETLLHVAEGWHTLADQADKALYHDGFATAAVSTATEPAPTNRHLKDPREFFALECTSILDVARKATALGLDRQCWTLIWHCETYLMRDARHAELVEHSQLALDSARRAKDDLGVGCMSLMLSAAYAQQAKIESAQASAQEALAAARLVGNTWLQAEALGQQAQVFERQGRTAEQRDALLRSVDLYKEVGELVSGGVKLTRLGELAARTDDTGAAAHYYEQGVAMLREAGAIVPLAQGLRRLAGSRRSAGDVPAAAALLRECLSLLREVDDPTGELCVCTDLALTLMEVGELAEAAELVSRALVLTERVSSPHYVAFAQMGHGVLLARQGDMKAAAARLGGALDGLRTIPAWYARNLIELGNVRLTLGDAQATDAFREAIVVAGKIDAAELAGQAKKAYQRSLRSAAQRESS